jgi:hypothetical protein
MYLLPTRTTGRPELVRPVFLGGLLVVVFVVRFDGPVGATEAGSETRGKTAHAEPAQSLGECGEESEPNAKDTTENPAESPNWRSLFDGKSLENWKVTQFGGQGDVHVEQGNLILERGNSMTGVTYDGPLPRTNYEVELQAKRVEGIDFFCGFTFPVGESFCSFIVGGWAGGVVGLSSIDGRDASENETTRYMSFPTGRWYRIRVRVTDDVIETWIDNESIVYQRIEGRRISTRTESDLSQPFGFATWETTAALKDIRIRELTGQEVRNEQLP